MSPTADASAVSVPPATRTGANDHAATVVAIAATITTAIAAAASPAPPAPPPPTPPTPPHRPHPARPAPVRSLRQPESQTYWRRRRTTKPTLRGSASGYCSV